MSPLINILTFEHGVSYGQTVVSTEIQQQNRIRAQVRRVISHNQTPPGQAIIVQSPPVGQWDNQTAQFQAPNSGKQSC